MPELQGVILICHGLNSDPESMKALSQFLKEEGIEPIEVTLKGHSGPLSEMEKVSSALWLDELHEAFKKAQEQSTTKAVPLYYLGFSLGGLLNAALMQREPSVRYDKILLFAPALSLRLTSELARVFKIFKESVKIPSLSPREYNFHKFITVAAYKALFDLLDGVRKENFRDLNHETLVFMDPLDELVSSQGLQKLQKKHHLDRWELVNLKKDKTTALHGFRHLILDEPTLGKSTWAFVQLKVKSFLSS